MRVTFPAYMKACLEHKIENEEDPVEFTLNEIPNRNIMQVPDRLWHRLILNHLKKEAHN